MSTLMTGTLPLDVYADIVTIKFPRIVAIGETECNLIPPSAGLFKKRFHDDFCCLEARPDGKVLATIFRCSSTKKFVKIEDAWVQGAGFLVSSPDEMETLIKLFV